MMRLVWCFLDFFREEVKLYRECVQQSLLQKRILTQYHRLLCLNIRSVMDMMLMKFREYLEFKYYPVLNLDREEEELILGKGEPKFDFEGFVKKGHMIMEYNKMKRG